MYRVSFENKPCSVALLTEPSSSVTRKVFPRLIVRVGGPTWTSSGMRYTSAQLSSSISGLLGEAQKAWRYLRPARMTYQNDGPVLGNLSAPSFCGTDERLGTGVSRAHGFCS